VFFGPGLERTQENCFRVFVESNVLLPAHSPKQVLDELGVFIHERIIAVSSKKHPATAAPVQGCDLAVRQDKQPAAPAVLTVKPAGWFA
jgi:hypothetical protein